jgi:hypothetical protein
MNRTVKLLDYSFDRPNIAAVKALGYVGVLRYLTGAGKAITHSERENIEAHGLGWFAIYESTAGRAGAGHGAGVADAQRANQAARDLGAADIPVFMAVDFDATFAQVKPYFEGASPILGKGRRGAYASGLVLRQLRAAGLIDWAWEAGARAWGDGRRDPDAHILQDPSSRVAGASVDVNHADPSVLAAMRPAPQPTGHTSAWRRARLKLRQRQLAATRARIEKDQKRAKWLQGRIDVLNKDLKP